MKQSVLFLLLGLMAVACNNLPENQFAIKGTIEGDAPDSAYLIKYVNRVKQIVDSSAIINGKFDFNGAVELPELMSIEMGEQPALALFVENSNITLTAKADSLASAKINGSASHEQYSSYLKSKETFETQMAEIYQQYKSTTDTALQNQLEVKYDSIEAVKNIFARDYVLANGNSVIAAYIIRRELIYTADLAELTTLTNALDSSVHGSVYAKDVFEKLSTLQNLEPGKPAPLFSQNTPSGDVLGIEAFKGKYLLIDFWASWCGPCRRANPTLVKVYEKYNKLGFEILGVSLDKNADDWKAAIEADGLTWAHVSDLGFWNNAAVNPYAVSSIPHGVLVAPDGTIIKRNIHAQELDALLGSYLK